MAGANGRRSASRFDLSRSIRIAILLPARFCWYSSPAFMVMKISKPALSSKLADEYGFGKFQRGDRGFMGHGGEVVEEFAQGLSALQVLLLPRRQRDAVVITVEEAVASVSARPALARHSRPPLALLCPVNRDGGRVRDRPADGKHQGNRG